MGRALPLALILSLFGWLLGCEDQQEVDLYKAQLCIDKATSANVGSCLSLIEGDTSDRAAVLRCSAAFIAEDITETAIAEALQNLEDDDPAIDPTTPMLTSLAMDSSTASSDAVTECEKTGSAGLKALANMANIATAMSIVLSFPPNPTPAQVQNLIDTYAGTPNPNTTVLGNAIVSANASLCDPDDGLFKDEETCTDLAASIAAGGGNADAVAQDLINQLNSSN